MFVAAFFTALIHSCLASSYDKCPEHQLVSDAAINSYIAATARHAHFWDESVFEHWGWGPFLVNFTSQYISTRNIFEPFTRYCKGGDVMVDTELEFDWLIRARCAVLDQEDFLGTVDVYFHQAVAKVQFQLNLYSEYETFTLYPAGVRLTWPGTVSASVHGIEPQYYAEALNVLLNPLFRVYANDILSWISPRFVIANLFLHEANIMDTSYVDLERIDPENDYFS